MKFTPTKSLSTLLLVLMCVVVSKTALSVEMTYTRYGGHSSASSSKFTKNGYLGVGIHVTKDSFFPLATFELRVFNRMSIGIAGTYFKQAESDGTKATVFGAFATATIHTGVDFLGLYVQGGIGALGFNAVLADGGKESATARTSYGVIGWRTAIEKHYRFNLGFGVLKTDNPGATHVDLGITGVRPLLNVQLGITF